MTDREETAPRPSLLLRMAGSVAVATGLFLVFFYKFLPYGKRDWSEHTLPIWPLLAALLVAGFLLSWGLPRRRYWVCHTMLATFFAANCVMIHFDLIEDRTGHNLLPFEFILLAIWSLPAYAGTTLAVLGARFCRLHAR
jgi:hypothetical protein